MLVDIEFPSIYMSSSGHRLMMPDRMAHCTPDTRVALLGLQKDVAKEGGELILSDLYRSYDMQLQAYLDYVTKKKKSFSPAPVGSMHESGRAFDISLNDLKIPLARFWELAKKRGVVPIVAQPNTRLSEAWHFECRGSTQLIFNHVKALGSSSNLSPAKAMAMAGACDITTFNPLVDDKQTKLDPVGFHIQTMLVRLMPKIETSVSATGPLGDSAKTQLGNLDGRIGPKTRAQIARFAITTEDPTSIKNALVKEMQAAYPNEYF